MSKVVVKQLSSAEPESQATNILDQIRRKAFELFEQRGHATGKDIDDWLNAERDIIFVPVSEMVVRDSSVELRIAAPGFKADELELRADSGGCRSAFRTDVDQDSEGMPISVPNGSRSVLRW
ncbi:MAG: DUF2934 domain-containing protein [Bryobacteraceae bacterium]